MTERALASYGDPSLELTGFEWIEERMQSPDGTQGEHRIYSWVFPGRPAHGDATRLRFTETATLGRAAELDVVWNALLASWRPHPIGAR
jgi:hypothetical protein